ncbi:ATP-binding protein [Allorhizocola rhizosphaerae]|uniref:ATP-binding protein n=1 Tax=Allorhizocola rhizosphaerae TaxID=1872709 RepID=UPI000E3CFF26|nr:tetratricopeptide repeat protein [Allorhizocola rhizosphaerae]
MGRLRQPLVPDGPIRQYYERLHALHAAAGEPSMRQLQRRTRSDRRPAGINPTTIHDVFTKPRLSRWEVVNEIVTQLGGEVEEFAELWHRAREAEVLDDGPRPVAAAPAGTTVPPPRMLPTEVYGFIGRGEQLKHLDELVGADAGGVPIAVLTGMGGIGKTALAVHWAHRVADRFPDGQLFVNLHGFDPAGRAVPPATALRAFLDAYGVPADRIPAELDALTAYFRSLVAGRRILLVLDNARNAEQVRPLLPGSGPAVVVVTSRDQLTSLVAVEGAQPLRLDPLSNAEAWRLLARRLGAQRIEAEPETTDAIVAACGRLPLALAVVAARAQQSGFALAEVTAEVLDAARRLDALDAGDPASQVRAVFSWSYASLTEPAARMFRLLGRHPGPGISVTAAASLAGVPVAEARRTLTELTQANLLSEYAARRYSTHDLLRAYAAELIPSRDGECARAAINRLIDHYVHVAHAANRLIHPLRDPSHLPLTPPAPGVAVERIPDVNAAIAWLDIEHPVLLAILHQPDGTASARSIWQLAWAVETFLGRRGYWHDLGSAWEAGIRAGRRLGDPRAEAHALRGAATAQIRLTRYEEAERHLDRALDLYAQAGDQVGQALTYRAIQSLQTKRGDRRAGVIAIERALALFRFAGHHRGQAGSLNNLGVSLLALGKPDRAVACCDEALALFEQLGDPEGQAHTWDTLGLARHRLGQYADAVDGYERALALYRALGDRYEEAGTLSRLGDTHHATGGVDAARAAWQQAADLLSDLRHPDAERVMAKLHALH